MWSSTRPNTADECVWEHAPFNGGYSEYNADAFNQVKDTVCPNGILAKEYDTASQIMGGNWRMPTETEWKELIGNTNSVWVTNYNGTGVNGRQFTSKINGNTIFIPAAGDCRGGSVSLVGNYGRVWSSSLYTSDPYNAWYLYFSSGCRMYNINRYYGQSVRGVRK